MLEIEEGRRVAVEVGRDYQNVVVGEAGWRWGASEPSWRKRNDEMRSSQNALDAKWSRVVPKEDIQVVRLSFCGRWLLISIDVVSIRYEGIL